MQKIIIWLRKSGIVGNQLATVVSLLATNWGLTLSALIAILVASRDWALHILLLPEVQVGLKVFLVSLWTYIGLAILQRMKKPLETVPVPDYQHGLTIDALHLGVSKDGDSESLQVSAFFQNLVSGPIRLHWEQYRVVIEGRTVPDTDLPDLIVPRFGKRGLRSGTIKKDIVGASTVGQLDVTILYGPVEGPSVRRYKMRSKLHIGLAGDALSIAEESVFTIDEPI